MSHKKQQGAALLIELAIVAVLASLGIGAELLSQRARLIDERFAAQGDLIATAKGGVNTYIATNYAALVANTPIPGYANIYSPTIPELRAVSLLPTGFSDIGLFGQAYAIQVSRTPATCVPPACDITGLVYLNGAITDPATGRVEGAGLGTAIAAIGGDGAYSSSIDPTTLAGRDGAFALPNPAGSIAGILGARTGYGSSSFAEFLRRDGSLPMTGDLDMGAQNIGSAKNITATGTLASRDVAATGTIAGKDLTATASITSAGQMKAGSRLITDEFVQVNGVVVAGATCSPNGLIARDAVGLTLSCQSGFFQKLGGSTTFFEVGTFNKPSAGTCIQANPLSGGCYCPPGTKWQQMTGQIYHRDEWDGTVYACIS